MIVSEVLAQLRALSVLMLRFWKRGPLASARPRADGRRASGLVLRMVFVVVFANYGVRMGHNSTWLAGDHGGLAVQWLALGVGGLAAIFGLSSSGVWARGVVTPLQAPLLDTLPLWESTRVALAVAQNVGAHVLCVGAVYGASGEVNLGRAILLGLALSMTCTLVGTAIMRLLRTVVPATRIARITAVVIALQFVFFLIPNMALFLAQWEGGAWVVAPLAPLGTAIVRGGDLSDALLSLFLPALVAGFGVAAAERIGYDRVDAVPTKRIRAAQDGDLTVDRVERLLMSREPQRRMVWFAIVYSALLVGGAVALSFITSGSTHFPRGETLVRWPLFLSTTMAFSSAAGRAARLSARDLVARPLLAPLPIGPSDLLRGKAAAVRRQMLLLGAPLVGLVLLPGPLPVHLQVLWRVATTILALWLTADAAVSVAFLTTGLGSTNARGGVGSGFGLEGTLLFLPLMGVAMAPYAWSAVVSLACVALLSFEARRAALGCVRWLDDGEGFERETPVWRALLVFTAFQATQVLAMQLLELSAVEAATATAIAYLASAAALLALTFYERRDLPPIRLLPDNAFYIVLGLAGGLASGAVAVGYNWALVHFGLKPASPAETAGTVLFAAVAVFAAPIAEETFFRGWLQDVVGLQYPGRGKWFALAVASFAFAAVHPPIAFVPVLTLGLVAGGLFAASGSIAAGMIAHIVYNLVVTVAPFH